MKKMRYILGAVIAGVLATTSVAVEASEQGTPEEAKAMAFLAGDHAKKVGTDQAFKDFMDPAMTQFEDRDLYVYCISTKGEVLVNRASPKIIGKNFYSLKDVKGVFFQQEIIKSVEATGEGWADYHWKNPLSNKIEPKRAYSVKVSDTALCGVGAYQ